VTVFAALGPFSPENLIEQGGYVLLFLVVFAESGLLIGFFLPGDSLLFTAGAVAAGAFDDIANVQFNIVVLCIGLFLAAVLGDQVGYLIGSKVGPRLFNRPDSRLFRRQYVEKGEAFFAKHGPKAVILARFVPVVRTFVPTIAGVSRMKYSLFLRYNLVGGFAWAVGVTTLGYLFGNIPVIKNNFEIAILGVIAISLTPIAIEIIRHRRNRPEVA